MNQIFEEKQGDKTKNTYTAIQTKSIETQKKRNIIYKQKTSMTKTSKLINNMPKQNNLRQNIYKNAIEFNLLLSIYF